MFRTKASCDKTAKRYNKIMKSYYKTFETKAGCKNPRNPHCYDFFSSGKLDYQKLFDECEKEIDECVKEGHLTKK